MQTTEYSKSFSNMHFSDADYIQIQIQLNNLNIYASQTSQTLIHTDPSHSLTSES
jgi:hypothetical protein